MTSRWLLKCRKLDHQQSIKIANSTSFSETVTKCQHEPRRKALQLRHHFELDPPEAWISRANLAVSPLSRRVAVRWLHRASNGGEAHEHPSFRWKPLMLRCRHVCSLVWSRCQQPGADSFTLIFGKESGGRITLVGAHLAYSLEALLNRGITRCRLRS